MSTIVFGGMSYLDVLTASAYNLAAAAYDSSYTFLAPSTMEGIVFSFSTASPRRVQIYANGVLTYDEYGSDLQMEDSTRRGFPQGAILRIAVSQTQGACTMTLRATAKQGMAPMTGNSIVQAQGLLPIRQWSQFYNLRSQRFLATTGYVTGNQNAAAPLALLRNPAGSGKVILLDQAEFGSSLDSRFSRFGGGVSTGLGTKQPVGQTDGGSGSLAAGELYKGGSSGAQYTISSPGTLRKVATMRAYQTYQILQIYGTAVLREGQQAYWVMDEPAGGGNGTYDAFIDFEWVEMPTATFTTIAAAMAAQSEY